MDSFAFMIHPLNPKADVSRKFPLLGRLLNERQIHWLSTYFPPVLLSQVTGVTSEASGRKVQGWLIACPLTAHRMRTLPEKVVLRKIIQTGRLAERLGARILGLGAFTSSIGDAGVTVARALDIPVTTGASYTAATALQALRTAASRVGLRPGDGCIAVVGATGAIGGVCAEMLAGEAGELLLIGRREAPLQALRERILQQHPGANLRLSTRLETLHQAKLILATTSAVRQVITPELLQPGSVICDVAQPRDVSYRAALRDDILVIDGGVVRPPGPVDFHFNFGLPPGLAYACMAETMALALEGRFESFTLGRVVSPTQVEEIENIARRHGFRLSSLRSFNRLIENGHLGLLKGLHSGRQADSPG